MASWTVAVAYRPAAERCPPGSQIATGGIDAPLAPLAPFRPNARPCKSAAPSEAREAICRAFSLPKMCMSNNHAHLSTFVDFPAEWVSADPRRVFTFCSRGHGRCVAYARQLQMEVAVGQSRMALLVLLPGLVSSAGDAVAGRQRQLTSMRGRSVCANDGVEEAGRWRAGCFGLGCHGRLRRQPRSASSPICTSPR